MTEPAESATDRTWAFLARWRVHSGEAFAAVALARCQDESEAAGRQGWVRPATVARKVGGSESNARENLRRPRVEKLIEPGRVRFANGTVYQAFRIRAVPLDLTEAES